MNTISKKSMIRTLIFTLFVLFSATAVGHGWRAGGWQGGGWYSGAAVIGAPIYYNYGCHNVRVCNRYGTCWLKRSCY